MFFHLSLYVSHIPFYYYSAFGTVTISNVLRIYQMLSLHFCDDCRDIVLHFVTIVYHIYWFEYADPSLRP